MVFLENKKEVTGTKILVYFSVKMYSFLLIIVRSYSVVTAKAVTQSKKGKAVFFFVVQTNKR